MTPSDKHSPATRKPQGAGRHPTHARRKRTGRRILIAGTGGQGVLTAARLLCDVFAGAGHEVVSGQLHGMAQRGGSVQSSVMIDCGISPMIGEGRADFVLGFEPVETARALPFVSARTVVYMNTAPVVPFVLAQRAAVQEGDATYPDVSGLCESIRAATPQVFSFDATRVAQDAGSGQALNMTMLGCLLGSGALPCTADAFWAAAAGTMPARLAETNAKAFFSGAELGRRFACV